MDDEQFAEHVKEERKLLHELSNKLMVIHGMNGHVKKKLEKQDPEDKEGFVRRLDKSLNAANAMIEEIKKRREHLHQLSK